jgi:hypothetical protein
VRDELVEEWRPRGAPEFILIDRMTQAYVMQLHWAEEAMRRAQGEPCTESYEFREWARHRKVQEKLYQWETGHWDIPYQHEAEAVEQAFRIVDLCMKSFQRAARQLANTRLVRAKTARARRRERAKTIQGVGRAGSPSMTCGTRSPPGWPSGRSARRRGWPCSGSRARRWFAGTVTRRPSRCGRPFKGSNRGLVRCSNLSAGRAEGHHPVAICPKAEGQAARPAP